MNDILKKQTDIIKAHSIDGVLQNISMQQLYDAVNDFVPLRQMHLTSKTQLRDVVDLKKIFCYLARKKKIKAFYVAQKLCADQSTINRNVKNFHSLMQTNDAFKELYLQIENKLLEEFKHISKNSY